jgi:hypothetical protein
MIGIISADERSISSNIFSFFAASDLGLMKICEKKTVK